MIASIITIHVIVCILLIILILIQRGRGGGLVESFSGVESMFGTKTSALLTRLTTILSVVFFGTCLTLALIAARQSRSLMRDIKTQEEPVKEMPVAEETVTETPVSEPAETETFAPETLPIPTPAQEEEASSKFSIPEEIPETQD